MLNVDKTTKLGLKPQDGTTIAQPFPSGLGGSKNFRIPGIVTLKDGTLVASADARWNEEKDGGGSDLVISRSMDHGKTWEYSFVGYLGDNGNEWNPDSSTLMDPLLMTDGTKLYLMADLFPAGYSISPTSTTHVFSETRTGFDGKGRLLLSKDGRQSYDYYLQSGNIYHINGEKQKGYTVDAWFRLYENGIYLSNLFFADAPFQVCATSYICMMTSVDGGKNWSYPKLLNVKKEGTVWMVLGPGKGLVTRAGDLMFSAYDGTNVFLLYSRDEGRTWERIQTAQANGESQLVELQNGTVRMFVRSAGTNQIQYIDFIPEADSYRVSKLVSTGVANFSNCMISVLKYSKTLKGKEILLLCCPSDATGGTWAGRFAGKIYFFAVDTDGTMTLVDERPINEGFFAYSCMTEGKDGSVDLLYEDDCLHYGAGDYHGECSHINYLKIEIKLRIDNA